MLQVINGFIPSVYHKVLLCLELIFFRQSIRNEWLGSQANL